MADKLQEIIDNEKAPLEILNGLLVEQNNSVRSENDALKRQNAELVEVLGKAERYIGEQLFGDEGTDIYQAADTHKIVTEVLQKHKAKGE